MPRSRFNLHPSIDERAMKALLDFIPLILFFYFFKTEGVFPATQVLLISTTVVYFLHFVLQKGKLEKVQWITLFATIGFGGLTLLLHDDFWLRWKSTVINWIFALIFIAGNVIPIGGKPHKTITERLLGQAFDLTHDAWVRLGWVWAGFFFVLGSLHLFFAFVLPDWWVDFKVFGSLGITMLFLIMNFVFLNKHLRKPDA
jgi:intracellular septation protein